MLFPKYTNFFPFWRISQEFWPCQQGSLVFFGPPCRCVWVYRHFISMVPVTFRNFFFKSSINGQFWGFPQSNHILCNLPGHSCSLQAWSWLSIFDNSFLSIPLTKQYPESAFCIVFSEMQKRVLFVVPCRQKLMLMDNTQFSFFSVEIFFMKLKIIFLANCVLCIV